MKSTAFATLVTLFFAIAGVFAQQDTPFYTTYPIGQTQLKAGQDITITWLNGLDQDVTVRLLEGTNTNNLSPTGIEFTVDGSSGSYDWTVPASVDSSATYALQYVYSTDEGSTEYNYSGQFSISGGSGASSSIIASSSVAATSSPVPSQSASASASASQQSSSSAPSSSSASKTQSASQTPTPDDEESAAMMSAKWTIVSMVAPALIAVAMAA
ncbi:Ser-Thr-rich glycosyl-phosphatidyl-inositol-anchored membrane family-domain-containing protein [Circinella umbellata]|nr:Ser-Thr-rich glycosyl-phosphatidyl-inositol-anchored membrane family-domain-containing protein [Circinella umbellata]